LISLIIPHFNQIAELLNLLKGIANWDLLPDEIIVVDSSSDSNFVNLAVTNVLEGIGIKFHIIHCSNKYPGAARNIGLNASSGEFVAFLDVRTIPTKNWLLLAIENLLSHPNASGVYGETYYTVSSFFSKLIRLSSYGELPLQTLPGSVFRRETMNIVGNFIGFCRAGEDTDWMVRLRLHGLYMLKASSTINYSGLNDLTLSSLLRKWYRNYQYAAELPYLHAHKNIYSYVLMVVSILIAFNWNWIVAGWDSESEYYIPHITKILMTSLIFAYVLIRGLLIPMKKGALWVDLIPFNWVVVAGLSALLDATKILAFAKVRIKRD
jgi:glycosyltransferase involved in cell wall biosynthesis